MASHRTPAFDKLYAKLDSTIQALADAAYEQYKRDPRLVGYAFKGPRKGVPVYGARLNENWRALAIEQDGQTYWFWIGIHTDYDRMLKDLSK